MKYCPSCLNQYTDLTLKFCLQDGTPLSEMPQKPQSTIDTVAFSRPVTAENFLPTTDIQIEHPQQNRTQPIRYAEPVSAPKRSRKVLIAAAVIFPLMALSVAGLVVGSYLLGERSTVRSEHQNAASDNEQPPAEPTPAVPETMRTDDQSAGKGEDEARTDIAALVEQWKTLTEGRDAEKLARMYAEKADHLGKDATQAEIRSTLQKKFDAYSDIDLDITNLSIALDGEGNSATALFDNEWDYEASPKLSSGKAHMKLQFQRSGGEWKIVSERLLKTYYEES